MTSHPGIPMILRLCALAVLVSSPLVAQSGRLDPAIDRGAAQVEGKGVDWRRDIHAHPELSNREVRTAQIVADHPRALRLEGRTGVAHNGVVGGLRGGRPG